VKRRDLFAFVAAVLATAPFPAVADDGPEVFAEIQDRLLRSAVLRADFRQERVLRILKRPLVSSGRMVLARDQGVLWQVAEPHRVTYLIRPAEILEWEAEAAPRRVGVAAVPGFKLLTEMFLAALAGDLTALAAAFDAEMLPGERGWRVRLTPKTPDLSPFIATLEMSGERFVEAVRLQESGGDAMAFAFDHFQTEPAQLNAAEEAYFAH
jgi:hypothetical protein